LFGYASLLEFKGGQQYKTICDDFYNFLLLYFYEAAVENEGGFYYMVSRDGLTLVDNSTQIYAESFTMAGLAQYFHANPDVPYVDEVFEALFQDIDFNNYDPVNGGYIEYYNTTGGRLAVPQKTAAGHLALLDGLWRVVLYDDAPEPDQGPRLVELINTFDLHFITANSIALSFDQNWNPTSPGMRNFGLELAAVYALHEAAAALNYENITKRVDTLIKQFGPDASTNGYDTNKGGYYISSTNGIVNNVKYYWVQSASLRANWVLYEMTKDPIYLDRIEKTTDFIKSTMVDTQNGEWYIAVADDGSKPEGTYKGTHTKGSMETLFATVNLPARINKYIADEF
jgi:mannose/cellobiose epimerase-like protein (N-acyl-D-glucosamine 2-epimerase family)